MRTSGVAYALLPPNAVGGVTCHCEIHPDMRGVVVASAAGTTPAPTPQPTPAPTPEPAPTPSTSTAPSPVDSSDVLAVGALVLLAALGVGALLLRSRRVG